MDLSHVFNVIIFLTNDLELFFEEFNSFLLWDMTFFCVVGLFDEVNEETREELNKVNLLILRPSEDLGKLASQYEIKLPQPFRYFTRGFGTRDTKSPDSLSLLHF